MSSDRQVEPRLLEVRAAAGGVRDDRLRARGARTRRPSRRARSSPSSRRPACSASAPQHSRVRRRHLVAVRREHARRGAVHLAEEDALHAAGQQADAREPLARGRRLDRRRDRLAPRRRELAQRLERTRRRQARERAAPSAAAADAGTRRTRPAAAAARDSGRGTCSSTCSRASSISRSYFTPGRARGEAGHAAEAAVEVLGDGAVQLDRPVERRLHQPDAAARRVHLLVEDDVRRAARQAEAAVHAVAEELRIHRRAVWLNAARRDAEGEASQPGARRLLPRGCSRSRRRSDVAVLQQAVAKSKAAHREDDDSCRVHGQAS